MGERAEKVLDAWRDVGLNALADCCGQVGTGCGEKCLAHDTWVALKEALTEDEIEAEVLDAVRLGHMSVELAQSILQREIETQLNGPSL